MGIIADSGIHNAGLKLLNDLVGWEDVYLMMDVTTGNPFSGGTTVERKAFQFTSLISKNESAYQKADNTNNKEFKICKISVDDIIAKNTAESVNIPIPPLGSLKTDNIGVRITNGTEYQIKVEGTGSFDGRDWWVLEIERDT
jgi:hypothetical protein